MVASCLGTPILLEHLTHPSAAWENLIAATLGATGLYIVQGLKKLGTTAAADPLGTYERWRRGAPAPGSSSPPIDTDTPQGGKP